MIRKEEEKVEDIREKLGPGPVWLYLAVAHALHGKARRLYYSSPVTGEVLIFGHNPYTDTLPRSSSRKERGM